MQEPAFKLVDFYPGGKQFAKERAAGPAHQKRVILAWQNDADIDAALGGAHRFSQRPQCSGSVAVDTSQPLIARPSQSA